MLAEEITGGYACTLSEHSAVIFMVRERLCLPNEELLSESARTFYLLRDFSLILVTVAYIKPKSAAMKILK